MKIEIAVALVTGANRGIGLAFTRRLLARGALEAGLDEVLADDRTRLVKQGLSAAGASYLPKRG